MRPAHRWFALLLLAACRAPAPAAERGAADRAPAAGGPQEIGRSVEGRSLVAWTLRSGGSGARRMYVIGGIHGDERTGGENVPRLIELFARASWAWEVRVVSDMNPDGTAGGRRANARGVDLNRNWPASNFEPSRRSGSSPLSEPEVRAVHADLSAFAPDLVVVLHAARRGPFTNWDGPAARLAARFADAAAASDQRWRVVDDMGYPTPGSIGTWIGVDRGLPILTIECARDQPSDEAWPALRAGFAALLADRDAPRVR